MNESTLAIWFWRIVVKRPRMLSVQFVALYIPCKPKPKPHIYNGNPYTCQYRYFHSKDKTVSRPSYLYNGKRGLYIWEGAQLLAPSSSCYLPVPQVVPVNPGAHVQVNPPPAGSLLHVAPLRQGKLEHWSVAETEKENLSMSMSHWMSIYQIFTNFTSNS